MAEVERAPPPFTVIGVLDLRQGRAVHAIGGTRERYQPITAVAGTPIDSGNADAVARFYAEVLGLDDVYVADLDAIETGAWQTQTLTSLSRCGARLWVDAGVRCPDEATRALAVGASRVVIGLETLPSFAVLREICAAVSGERVAFSLDLRDGVPIIVPGSTHAAVSAPALASLAADAGATSIIVLDLARVGAGHGCDLETLATVRRAAPDVTLLAGGGVRDSDDLTRLADAGCDGALVATALLTGRLKIRRQETEGRRQKREGRS